MSSSTHKLDFIAVLCAMMLMSICLAVRTARADQIIVLVDEHGNKIFVNTGDSASYSAKWRGGNFHPSRAGVASLSPVEINNLVERTAKRFQVDPHLIHAIIQVESEYNPHALSRKGAMGLMQLIPATANRFGVENPFDPTQNVEGGVTYLKYLLNLFGGDLSLSLAAYNAGENSVLRQGRIPPFSETRDYVRKVTSFYRSGVSPMPGKLEAKAPPSVAVTRYTDDQGVVHFSNVD